MPKYYIAKSDPDTYSLEDLKRDKETKWDGVHNFTALKHIRNWEIGDQILIYHSQGQAKIVGLAEVTSEPEEDRDDPRPSWYTWIKFIKEFDEDQQVSLKQIKATDRFTDFMLVRQGRLSVIPCPDDFIDWMREIGVKL